MNEPLPISVCVVARNEEKNLPRLLQSVFGWVSEIVVVLNNTTDTSAEIAARFGARIEHHPWIGYRDTKNAALGFVSMPWILALDADEEVSPALHEEIIGFFFKRLAPALLGSSFSSEKLVSGPLD